MSAHDRHLAGYSSSVIEVYCQNRECELANGRLVEFEREYGQSTVTPEECPLCLGPWGDSPPVEVEA